MYIDDITETKNNTKELVSCICDDKCEKIDSRLMNITIKKCL